MDFLYVYSINLLSKNLYFLVKEVPRGRFPPRKRKGRKNRRRNHGQRFIRLRRPKVKKTTCLMKCIFAAKSYILHFSRPSLLFPLRLRRSYPSWLRTRRGSSSSLASWQVDFLGTIDTFLMGYAKLSLFCRSLRRTNRKKKKTRAWRPVLGRWRSSGDKVFELYFSTANKRHHLTISLFLNFAFYSSFFFLSCKGRGFGYFRHSSDCQRYHVCLPHRAGGYRHWNFKWVETRK